MAFKSKKVRIHRVDSACVASGGDTPTRSFADAPAVRVASISRSLAFLAFLASQGKTGNAAQYVTRNQAIKKLQLRLSEFRRLCILKGTRLNELRER